MGWRGSDSSWHPPQHCLGTAGKVSKAPLPREPGAGTGSAIRSFSGDQPSLVRSTLPGSARLSSPVPPPCVPVTPWHLCAGGVGMTVCAGLFSPVFSRVLCAGEGQGVCAHMVTCSVGAPAPEHSLITSPLRGEGLPPSFVALGRGRQSEVMTVCLSEPGSAVPPAAR